MMLARASLGARHNELIVTPDVESAKRMVADLRFFLGEGLDDEETSAVLSFPAIEGSPYQEVAPDRAATMDRLATLAYLSTGQPWRFIVAPARALLRRVVPRQALRSRSIVIEAETEIDRGALIALLEEGGYLRVPMAEDPGTFAVRGSILDIYSPHGPYPARVELDDWLVLSIKLFDAEEQRTLRETKRFFIHPVQETMMGEAEQSLAQKRVRTLCDDAEVPTVRTRQILDELATGRAFYGIQGLLPAFYPQLETLFDHLPDDAGVVLVDPTKVALQVQAELQSAADDELARRAEKAPTFELQAHYLSDEELLSAIEAHPHAIVHSSIIGGEASEDESPLARLDAIDGAKLLDLGGEDQLPLIAEIKQQRQTQGAAHSLDPLVRHLKEWLDAGMHVFLTARTHAQADRLRGLLRSYEVSASLVEGGLDPKALTGRPSLRAEIVVGQLSDGFVLGVEGVAFVTEEEIFGARARREARRKARKESIGKAFLSDLRELHVGDYIVHSDHGVGRYLGLERKALAQSALERMQGGTPPSLEVLVIEYSRGDRLFVPVTRLGSIQKYSGREGHEPRLDRLGGQTFDKKKAKVRSAVRNLADELLQIYARRAAARRDPLPPADALYAELEASFPFEETPDQARAIDEVLDDLRSERPMDRLVCGDVGFGKTEVAMRAAFRVASAGRQVALLCPTTVLAQQHYETFAARLGDYPLRVEVLSRFVDRAVQTETLAGLKAGKVDIVIGTHRLLSKDVHFSDLGLLVVDEEQRFGVAHKERIKKLRANVDVLTLSATPIPRTLQQAIGGLRELSVIQTAPIDRRAVRTIACRWDNQLVKEAIGRELKRGGQIFFVYNRIEGLYERAQKLQELIPEARIAVVHGQMPERALEKTMTDFVAGEHDILCSTAIIESGLDIPRANTMIVDRADLFGLAQLYQLRGRVGRSRERAYCYLLTPPPSSMTDEARSRIEALERFTQLGSGFQVASLDMELRGAGDLLGGEQSGNVSLVGFDLFVHMLEEAVAELRGETIEHEVDTELTVEGSPSIPEDYVEDIGLRLSFYKRFADARGEDDVADIATELEDRFGRPPSAARDFVRAMSLRPALRRLRALGCEIRSQRTTLHLRDDTPIDAAKLLARIESSRGRWKLSPDRKLTVRHRDGADGDAIDRAETALQELEQLQGE